MYTVEFESESTVITILCEKDDQEDVEIIIDEDNTVFIRQFQEYKNEYDIIAMTYNQLQDIAYAISSPEGMFKLEIKRG